MSFHDWLLTPVPTRHAWPIVKVGDWIERSRGAGEWRQGVSDADMEAKRSRVADILNAPACALERFSRGEFRLPWQR
jgi:hypothetical protein